ncbi:hypothetical protein [Fischerella sp. PCC 9605]|uniref:hypothetical protein n=1 Tax=Fischerella sp. PCC 9605 TaxID=1173024 RepID=UPI0004B81870|nr:hypothetical protein [Fischerella sp. PCC 9605]
MQQSQLVLCQTPTRGWVNLAYARQIQFRKIHIHMSWQFACHITWSNGNSQTFFGKDAEAIAQTLKRISPK